MTQEPLSIVQAKATGVLGKYHHEITFEHDERFRIIYGPNGVGKTKFLEIIDATLRLDGPTLQSLPYDVATLAFSDGSALLSQPILTDEEDHESDQPTRVRRSEPAESKTTKFILLAADRTEFATWEYNIGKFERWIRRSTEWRPTRFGLYTNPIDDEYVTLDQLAARFPSEWQTATGMPEELQLLQRRVSSLLIETQRLNVARETHEMRRPLRPSVGRFKDEQAQTTSKTEQIAERMRELITDAQTRHSVITQQLDRTFPMRVLETSESGVPSENEILSRYEEQDAFRSRLGNISSVALEDKLPLQSNLSGWQRTLLSVYLEDAHQKFEPFKSLVDKIGLFEDIMNSRLRDKTVRVTANDGVSVTSDKDEAIELASLSSGEQHELVLMFQLLFEVPGGALVMIDEPEISLHVAWQVAFIPDVERISRLSGFRFIVATHSPQIINNAWSRATALGPLESSLS